MMEQQVEIVQDIAETLHICMYMAMYRHIAPAMEHHMENEMALGLYKDNLLDYIAHSLNS